MKPPALVLGVFAVLAFGILFLSWKDIYAEIPRLDQLHEARANGWRADIARESWGASRYSIEFFESSGRRFQVKSMEKPDLDAIAAALPSEVPVLIRYGPWRAAFPSAKIFTVYQIEVGDRVVIPYARLASACRREQLAGPLIMLCTIFAAALAIVLAMRSQLTFQRKLALLKSGNSKPTGR